MINVRKLAEKINIRGRLLFEEPMRYHTSFKIGGPADLFVIPANQEELKKILFICKEESAPYFLLGSGANILVSDKGIRGVVIDLKNLGGISVEGNRISAGAGVPISDVSLEACNNSLTGLEFIYSMPGSVGGSVWMNARCYGKSVSDILEKVTILDKNLFTQELAVDKSEFGYKVSPFQKNKSVILAATFKLKTGKREKSEEEMDSIRRDREKKGHFLFPSAGSVFKNNRDFGMPTGKLLERVGLKGLQIGEARVSDFHANIIINMGNARASDVKKLIEMAESRINEQFGFKLEREIIFVGEW